MLQFAGFRFDEAEIASRAIQRNKLRAVKIQSPARDRRNDFCRLALGQRFSTYGPVVGNDDVFDEPQSLHDMQQWFSNWGSTAEVVFIF